MSMISHRPVMVDELLSLLRPRTGGCYVDATVGEGGHAAAILEASAPSGRLIGCDRDPEILRVTGERLAPFGSRCELRHADYRTLSDLLSAEGVERVDGVLIDLGLSSYHLEQPERGFSFRSDGPLDMRFDRTSGEPAAELIGRLSEAALCELLQQEGEERWARRIARAIVRRRQEAPITTTGELASLIERVLPPAARHGRIHPATRTFQALRIAVNRELEGLGEALDEAAARLAPEGTLCVVTYHSLEDRVVKWRFRALAAAGGFEVLTRRPLRPSASEIDDNPRARSAKLRAIRRMGGMEG
jgi:16S rRNA (cytosine1402-N4)-methyltransferase